MKLILLGAPGAGKGTQAELIMKHAGILSVSTGNLLRAAVKNNTKLGKLAKEYMDAGALVPDEIVLSMIKEHLADEIYQKGCIFDGFPRTVFQAAELDKITDIDSVLSIEVPDEVIETRMSGRRVCPSCGATFHIDNKPPKVQGICDKCGEGLILRKDDCAEVVRDRLRAYHEQTEPLKGYYEKQGKLKMVAGTGEIDAIFSDIKSALGI